MHPNEEILKQFYSAFQNLLNVISISKVSGVIKMLVIKICVEKMKNCIAQIVIK